MVGGVVVVVLRVNVDLPRFCVFNASNLKAVTQEVYIIDYIAR